MSLQVKPIDSESVWERFLLTHAPQSVFQSWLWGEVQIRSGSSVLRVGLFDSEKLVGICAIYTVHAKRGTYLHIRHGPIVANGNTQYWRRLLDALIEYAKKESAWFIRVSPLIEATEEHKTLLSSLGFVPSPMHAMDAEVCWVLDIAPSEEVLLANLRKTTRYEIRKAQHEGISVTKSTNPKDLDAFFTLYRETTKRHNFIGHRGIREEFEIFAKKGKALLLLGKEGNQIVSGAIVLFYGNQAVYHHGASVRSRIPVSSLVQWEAILEAKKRGLKVYNFWGIAPDDSENHPWRGITVFKKGFGGYMVEYIHAHDYPLSPFYVLSKTVETIRRKMKGYQ